MRRRVPAISPDPPTVTDITARGKYIELLWIAMRLAVRLLFAILACGTVVLLAMLYSRAVSGTPLG